jgi:hypothetical protein
MSMHEQFADNLALHALGSLAGAEREELEKHLGGCADCRRELEFLRGDMSLLALTAAGPKPPLRARQRLLSAIALEGPRPARVPVSRSNSFALEPEVPSWWSTLVWPSLRWVAAAALLVVSIGLVRQNAALEHDLASMGAQFRSRLNDQGSKLQQANEVVATLLDPDTTKIELVVSGNKPQPRGKVLFDRRKGNLIFFASNLPPLPAEKIYELWLFPATGGAPVAAGLFIPDARGSATVLNPPLPKGIQARSFAVTLEPASGSHEAPRGTAVIVGLGE